ncbi:uncharacterized protein LOC113204090 [Frankliniella occidentalis]|uniref:Uncharacterized protein LOC113204090 n=1 Tax=Frankliniella occidentalis TaxID=133901 RepID=A0A6J1S143_FRAOC|nr:uncharacterized protein LOC113204090 [Frankliniella occidentalis]
MGCRFQREEGGCGAAGYNLRGSRSRMSLILVIVLLCQKAIHGKAINSLFGPYIAYVERFYNCGPDDLPWQWHLRVTHFNPVKPREAQLLTGNVTIDEPVDDSFGVKVFLDVRSNNQWKENAVVFAFKSGVCQRLKENMPTFYNLFYKKSETEGTCVLKPGVYEANNEPCEWVFPKFPILPYGQYRYRFTVSKLDRPIACLAAYCRIVPKL